MSCDTIFTDICRIVKIPHSNIIRTPPLSQVPVPTHLGYNNGATFFSECQVSEHQISDRHFTKF
jgi:hypothetical protein